MFLSDAVPSPAVDVVFRYIALMLLSTFFMQAEFVLGPVDLYPGNSYISKRKQQFGDLYRRCAPEYGCTDIMCFIIGSQHGHLVLSDAVLFGPVACFSAKKLYCNCCKKKRLKGFQDNGRYRLSKRLSRTEYHRISLCACSHPSPKTPKRCPNSAV